MRVPGGVRRLLGGRLPGRLRIVMVMKERVRHGSARRGRRGFKERRDGPTRNLPGMGHQVVENSSELVLALDQLLGRREILEDEGRILALRELQVAHTGPGVADHSETRRGDDVSRIAQIEVIRKIEGFETELKLMTLDEPEVFL